MESRQALIDPRVSPIKDVPNVLQVISVPKPGNGPHYIGEYGDDL